MRKWQHLSCDTGISLRQYRKMMKGAVVDWKCRECSRPAEVAPEVQMETADTGRGVFFCFSRVAGDTAIVPKSDR